MYLRRSRKSILGTSRSASLKNGCQKGSHFHITNVIRSERRFQREAISAGIAGLSDDEAGAARLGRQQLEIFLVESIAHPSINVPAFIGPVAQTEVRERVRIHIGVGGTGGI